MSKVIYFSGPDGSGKTTSFLRSLEVIEGAGLTVFQLRTLQVARLNMIARNQAKRQVGEKQLQENTLGSVGRLGYSHLPRQRGSGTRFTLRRYFGLLVALADIASYGCAFLRAKRKSYDVVLVEECPFDVFAKRHRPYFPRTAAIFKRLIPAPDLIVFCIADPSEIVRRKPELSEAEIVHYYSVMENVYRSLKKLPIYRHDTNLSKDPFASLDETILKTIR